MIFLHMLPVALNVSFSRIDCVCSRKVVEFESLEMDGKYTHDQIRSEFWHVSKQNDDSTFSPVFIRRTYCISWKS